MAVFPVIEATATSSTNTAGTDHVVEVSNLGTQAGDLILILMNIGSTSATLNAHADYSELLDENLASGLKILYRWATGGEGDPTFVTSASTRDASIALRISGAINPAVRLPQIGTTAATTDPPSVTPSQGTQEYLAIAMVGSAGEQLDNGTYVTAFPTGFDLAQLMKTCGTAGTNLGGCVGCAAAQLQQSAAINPGAFSVSESSSRAQTIVIHPAVLVAAKAGTGILDRHGSGASEYIPGTVHEPVTYDKYGQGTMGIKAPGNTYAKQNSGVAGFSGVAADSLLWVEAGAGRSGFSATALEATVAVESSAGILAASASGTITKGGATSKAGSGISGFSASGAEAASSIESGSGILAAIASGVAVKSGGGITYEKAGLGRMGVEPGTGPQTYVKQNAGILALVGSGASEKGRGGAGISARVGSGARAVVYVEADAGGGDAPEPPALESDHPANIVFRASGTATKAGAVVKTGSGLLGLSASGVTAKIRVKTGSGALVASASGSDASTRSESGAGILSASASGSKTLAGGATYAKQNSGIAGFSASASELQISVEAGTGIRGQSASGSKVLTGGATYSKQNSGIAGFSASALEATVFGENGSGILAASASGSKSIGGGATYAKDGAGIRGFAASGTDVAIRVETGAGSLLATASGSRSATRVKTGKGILSFVGSGAKETQLGATYQKSGAAILSSSAGGVRQRVLSRAGSGILERSGSARDVVSWSKGGSGMATFTASGERSYGHVPGAVTIVEQVGVELTLQRGLGAAVSVSERKKASLTVA